MSATMHGGEHAGWIYKQGSLVKNWKKRFMVLRGKHLTYYDTERITPRVKEKGSFQVITVELSSDIQNGLIVHGRGGRVLKLYTDSSENTNGWYHAIMDATNGVGGSAGMDRLSERYSSLSGGGGNNGSISSSGDLDDPLDLLSRLESLPLEDMQVQHSGWLTKEGMRVKSWKRRYFTLRGDTLSYFDSADTGSNAKGYGHVRAVEVNGEKTHSLDIRFDNGRILRVAAESASSMQEWLCKLSDAVEAAHMENNNARQSMAIRQSFRASMSSAPSMAADSRPSFSSALPLRHSIAGGPSTSQSQSQSYQSQNQSQRQPAPLVRPSIATMHMKPPQPPPSHPQAYDNRRTSNGSNYAASNYTAQSSGMSSGMSSMSNQSGEYYDEEEDSDSDGDWI